MTKEQNTGSSSIAASIREAFIALEREENLSSMNVSQLCTKAGISRTTFYKHYRNTAEVAEDTIRYLLDQATDFNYEILGYYNDNKESCGLPICEIIRRHPEYWPLIQDAELIGMINHQLTEHNKAHFANQNNTRNIREDRLDSVFGYISTGCIALIQANLKASDRDWFMKRETVDRFVRSGVHDLINSGKEETLYFPYGDHVQSLTIRKDHLIGVLEPADVPDGPDEDEIITKALSEPFGKPLHQIVHPGDKIAILVNDNTRTFPTWKVLPHLLRALYDAEVNPDDIVIIFGIGFHPPLSEREMRRLVGSNVYDTIRCVNSDPEDTVFYGVTQRGTPVSITREAAEADVRICVGNVEYNSMTGYSGGANLLISGAGSLETIRMNHRFIIQDSVDTAVNAGNPIFEDINEAADMVGIDFTVNAVMNSHKQIIYASAGELHAAHEAACHYLDQTHLRLLSRLADIVIAAVDISPESSSLVRSDKALMNAAKAVKDGGTIILVNQCNNGFGGSLFEEWMRNYHSLFDIKNAIYRHFQLGAHKAVQFMKISAKADIYLVSSMDPAFVKSTVIQPFSTLKDAYNAAVKKQGSKAAVLAMPFATDTYPRLKYKCKRLHQ